MEMRITLEWLKNKIETTADDECCEAGLSGLNTLLCKAGVKMIKDKLIDAGVKNLNEFGYPDANKSNICTDEVYSLFFISMLEENKGNGDEIDSAINELIAECSA